MFGFEPWVLGLQYGAGGRGSGGGLGVVGPAGMMVEERDEEGGALIGLGAKVGDIHRETSYPHWDVTGGFERGFFHGGVTKIPTPKLTGIVGQWDGYGWSG